MSLSEKVKLVQSPLSVRAGGAGVRVGSPEGLYVSQVSGFQFFFFFPLFLWCVAYETAEISAPHILLCILRWCFAFCHSGKRLALAKCAMALRWLLKQVSADARPQKNLFSLSKLATYRYETWLRFPMFIFVVVSQPSDGILKRTIELLLTAPRKCKLPSPISKTQIENHFKNNNRTLTCNFARTPSSAFALVTWSCATFNNAVLPSPIAMYTSP